MANKAYQESLMFFKITIRIDHVVKSSYYIPYVSFLVGTPNLYS